MMTRQQRAVFEAFTADPSPETLQAVRDHFDGIALCDPWLARWVVANHDQLQLVNRSLKIQTELDAKLFWERIHGRGRVTCPDDLDGND